MGLNAIEGAHRAFIAKEAQGTPIPPRLLYAMVQVESNWMAFATRYEPGYRWLWNVEQNVAYNVRPENRRSDTAPADFPGGLTTAHTEWHHQRTSWGLFQVMGATARWLGFQGYLPALCGSQGPHYAIKYLEHLHAKHFRAYGWDGVVAAYNAGSPRRLHQTGAFVNQWYVDRVIEAGGLPVTVEV